MAADALSGRAARRKTTPSWLAYRAVYSVVLALLAWEIASRTALINPFFMPAPSLLAVQAAALTGQGELLPHMGATLLRAIGAILLSVAIGVSLGIAMARIAAVRWFFDPLISLGLPTPKIALWPIFVLWFGFHDQSKIFLTTFACAFPLVSATYLATRDVDRYLLWSARALGTGERRMLWKVIFRAAVPDILTGVQTILPLAFILIVLTEMLSGGVGLGSMIMIAGRLADIPTVLVGVAAASILGFAVIRLCELLRARMLVWHEETTDHA